MAFFFLHIYRWSCSSTLYINICTVPSFLCKSLFLQPDRCIVCFLFIIRKSITWLCTYIWLGFDPICTWMWISNTGRCWEFIRTTSNGNFIHPAKATSDFKKMIIWTLDATQGERVYLITTSLSTRFPEFYTVKKYGCAKRLKTDIENEKKKKWNKLQKSKKNTAYVWWYVFSVCLLKWPPQWSTEVRKS